MQTIFQIHFKLDRCIKYGTTLVWLIWSAEYARLYDYLEWNLKFFLQNLEMGLCVMGEIFQSPDGIQS